MLVGPIKALDATVIVRTLGHRNCSKTELIITPSEPITENRFQTMQFSIV